MSDEQILAADIGLQEAQHALAKEYGFSTWAGMKHHIVAGTTSPDSAKAVENTLGLLSSVSIRQMTRSDQEALRRFDDEMTGTIDAVNAQHPPDGTKTVPGGPWSDDKEMAEHFEMYQRQGGAIILACDPAGRIVGFADLWPTEEPEPFGRSLNVECIDYFREYYLSGLETMLLSEAEKVAREMQVPSLDIGTNTCSGEFVSLRRFGLKVFYEYDNVTCRCQPGKYPRPERRQVALNAENLSGLIKANHWSPTDFSFPGESHLIELRWPDQRAVIEFWHYRPGQDDLPVIENPPNRSELFVEPKALKSSSMMTDILVEGSAIAGEFGADSVELSCPSDIHLDESRLDIIDREFAFAWLRKAL